MDHGPTAGNEGWGGVYLTQNVGPTNEGRVIFHNENKGSLARIMGSGFWSGKHSRCPSFINHHGHITGTQ